MLHDLACNQVKSLQFDWKRIHEICERVTPAAIQMLQDFQDGQCGGASILALNSWHNVLLPPRRRKTQCAGGFEVTEKGQVECIRRYCFEVAMKMEQGMTPKMASAKVTLQPESATAFAHFKSSLSWDLGDIGHLDEAFCKGLLDSWMASASSTALFTKAPPVAAILRRKEANQKEHDLKMLQEKRNEAKKMLAEQQEENAKTEELRNSLYESVVRVQWSNVEGRVAEMVSQAHEVIDHENRDSLAWKVAQAKELRSCSKMVASSVSGVPLGIYICDMSEEAETDNSECIAFIATQLWPSQNFASYTQIYPVNPSNIKIYQDNSRYIKIIKDIS